MIISLEHIYHYRCDHCDKWWSISDVPTCIGAISHCPHCGHNNVVERIESHQNGVEQLRLLPVVGHKCTTNHSACDCVLEQLTDKETDLEFQFNRRMEAEKRIKELFAENTELLQGLAELKDREKLH